MKLTHRYTVITSIPDFSYLDGIYKERWKAWIEALRSGKYLQSQGQLYDPNLGYCVLGLACELVDGVVGEWVTDKYDTYFFKDSESNEKSYYVLTGDVVNYYALPRDDGFDVELWGDRHATLLTLNDRYKASFQEFAEILEIALAGGYQASF